MCKQFTCNSSFSSPMSAVPKPLKFLPRPEVGQMVFGKAGMKTKDSNKTATKFLPIKQKKNCSTSLENFQVSSNIYKNKYF